MYNDKSHANDSFDFMINDMINTAKRYASENNVLLATASLDLARHYSDISGTALPLSYSVLRKELGRIVIDGYVQLAQDLIESDDYELAFAALHMIEMEALNNKFDIPDYVRKLQGELESIARFSTF